MGLEDMGADLNILVIYINLSTFIIYRIGLSILNIIY